MNHAAIFTDRKLMLKGESIDEERNQESCEAGEEEGRTEEEEVSSRTRVR